MFDPTHPLSARRLPDPVGHYERLLRSNAPSNEFGSLPLDEPGIRERMKIAQAHLSKLSVIVKPPNIDEVQNMLTEAPEGMRMVQAGEGEQLRNNRKAIMGLEVIARIDGSRPSFLIRNDSVVLDSSPVGAWGNLLKDLAVPLQTALQCVGRIDVSKTDQGFIGTGFLIQENVLLTNRHVLQLVATPQGSDWVFKSGASVDFGHEFRGRASFRRRKLNKVIACGPQSIDLQATIVDHSKHDFAIIELEPASADQRLKQYLNVDISPDWAEPQQQIITIGYPGNPGLENDSVTVLDNLFHLTFGYKRLALGMMVERRPDLPNSTVVHDATTLGGNSGSPILVAGRTGFSTGLHYGGRNREPRENWCHPLGAIIPDALRATLAGLGVEMVDPRGE